MIEETVKLVPSATVKDLLKEAKNVDHSIKIDENSFIVRNKDTKIIVFRGIKIRNNCWGITFLKHTEKNERIKNPDYPSPVDSIDY